LETKSAHLQKPLSLLEDLWLGHHRGKVLAISGAATLLIAFVDWRTESYVSMGFLYLFPIMFSAGYLPRWVLASAGVLCAALAERFSYLKPSPVRLSFEALALAACGLFIGELIRNRRQNLESQAQLKALVGTSPAAIVVVNSNGTIELANSAAQELLTPRDGFLYGKPVAAFLPTLHDAIRWEQSPQFRAEMECPGRRGDGESFTANVWFSTYKQLREPKVAAIIVEVHGEAAVAAVGTGATTVSLSHEGPTPAAAPTARESEVLRLLVQGFTNRQIADRMDITEGAVKNALQQLFAKTGVRSRSQLVRVALERYRDIL
jgi:DNA-binding CsgD family transcriptional regulator